MLRYLGGNSVMKRWLRLKRLLKLKCSSMEIRDQFLQMRGNTNHCNNSGMEKFRKQPLFLHQPSFSLLPLSIGRSNRVLCGGTARHGYFNLLTCSTVGYIIYILEPPAQHLLVCLFFFSFFENLKISSQALRYVW